MSDDEQAVERYRYLLRTAPPDAIEAAHAEAFAKLTPEQRQMVLTELTSDLPEGERAAAMRDGDDPRALARTATRAEMREPGTLERRFGGMGGVGMGGMMAGGFLSTIAGVVVGTAIADALFFNDGGGDSGDSGGDSGDAGGDSGDGGGDFAGGDFGGDFGGGDFGGGDF